MQVLVLAGTAYEARAWADDHGLRPRDYVYVGSARALRGRATGEQPRAIVGSFRWRGDAGEILEHLVTSDLTRYRSVQRATRGTTY